MNRSLLDTDTLSEIHRAHNRTILIREKSYRAEWGALSYSAITVMEVVRGYWQQGASKKLTHYLETLRVENVIPFTAQIAELAGKIDAELCSHGQPIGKADPIIAATAIEHGLVLVTGNTKHYVRIQKLGFPLQLANWRESDS